MAARSLPSGPHFLGIGAQKAGTTWLYVMLAQHPDLWLAPVKELHYWDEKIDIRRWTARWTSKDFGAVRWRRQLQRQLEEARERRPSLADLRWSAKFFLGSPNDDWYRALFAPGAGRVTGEITPRYSLVAPERVAHIRRQLPDLKLVFLMRNPIERAWSSAGMSVRRRGMSGAEAARLLREHVDLDRSRRVSDYLQTLEAWSVFPPDQIFVGYIEDIAYHPQRLLQDIHAFLGVAPAQPPEGADEPVHAGTQATMPGEVARHLASTYEELTRALDRRFGGYANWWAYTVLRVLDDPSADAVAYPFASGPWLEEWLRREGLDAPVFQSGPLA